MTVSKTRKPTAPEDDAAPPQVPLPGAPDGPSGADGKARPRAPWVEEDDAQDDLFNDLPV